VSGDDVYARKCNPQAVGDWVRGVPQDRTPVLYGFMHREPDRDSLKAIRKAIKQPKGQTMSATIEETAPVKPGYKTTEFWLTLATTAVGALLASGVIEAGSAWDKAIGVVVSVLGALGYTVARGMAKRQ
jgi:hypothetical protein